MDLVQIEWDGVNWISLAQNGDKRGALVNAAMKLRIIQNAGKLSRSYTNGGLLSSPQLHGVSIFGVLCS
jgi:hypothetical protein